MAFPNVGISSSHPHRLALPPLHLDFPRPQGRKDGNSQRQPALSYSPGRFSPPEPSQPPRVAQRSSQQQDPFEFNNSYRPFRAAWFAGQDHAINTDRQMQCTERPTYAATGGLAKVRQCTDIRRDQGFGPSTATTVSGKPLALRRLLLSDVCGLTQRMVDGSQALEPLRRISRRSIRPCKPK